MAAQILKPAPESLALAGEALRRGELVAMPTETVYGLAGSALNPLALARIFETKERPTFDPLIVHVGFSAKRLAELERLKLVRSAGMSSRARELAERLMESFWPGPLTLVLPKHEDVPELATSGLETVALRMPRHPVAQALIAASGLPLAAPSANRFGRISPTTAEAVQEELGERIDWILDGGPCEVGVESTIVSVSTDGSLTLLRPGGLPVEEIAKVAQAPVPRGTTGSGPVQAPGMLESHYAPQKPLILLPSPLRELEKTGAAQLGAIPEKAALLSVFLPEKEAREKFRALTGVTPFCLSLSETGDLNEAARNLFRSLRALDQSDCPVIYSEPCPLETGLGFAIGDRLRRASAKRPA